MVTGVACSIASDVASDVASDKERPDDHVAMSRHVKLADSGSLYAYNLESFSMRHLYGLLILAFVVTPLFIGCQDSAAPAGGGDAPAPAASGDSAAGFSDPAIADYVKKYDEYIDEYHEIAKSKDWTKFAELGPIGEELREKAEAFLTSMSTSDAQKFNDYMTKSAERIQEYARKMAAQ